MGRFYHGHRPPCFAGIPLCTYKPCQGWSPESPDFRAKSGDFAIRADSLCVHIIKLVDMPRRLCYTEIEECLPQARPLSVLSSAALETERHCMWSMKRGSHPNRTPNAAKQLAGHSKLSVCWYGGCLPWMIINRPLPRCHRWIISDWPKQKERS